MAHTGWKREKLKGEWWAVKYEDGEIYQMPWWIFATIHNNRRSKRFNIYELDTKFKGPNAKKKIVKMVLFFLKSGRRPPFKLTANLRKAIGVLLDDVLI